jgi:hypothetical protein
MAEMAKTTHVPIATGERETYDPDDGSVVDW